jgi:LPXTG-site transpeptidase (sortase) family protein
MGAALLSVAVAPIAAGLWGQREAQQRWDQILVTSLVDGPDGPTAELFQPVDGLDFRMRVPRLGYSEVVREGASLGMLALGPGHYPQTAWPGQPGEVGLAAHNVYGLHFDDLQRGDEIVLEARYGLFRYRVTGSQVVSPGDGRVIDPAPGRRLTLTSGWPLWAGPFATQRLAIFAEEETLPAA